MGAEARNVTHRNVEELAQWCGGLAVSQFDAIEGTTVPGLNVPTLAGVQRANAGDTIVMSADGFFTVIKHPPTISPS